MTFIKKRLGVVMIFISLTAVYSCNTIKTVTIWVNGAKVQHEKDSNSYLSVHEGEDLSNPSWELWKEPIEGFVFESGVLQKIKVEKKAGKYRLLKVLKKQKSSRVIIGGKWFVRSLKKEIIKQNHSKIPSLNIELDKGSIFGNDGCNQYRATISELTEATIGFKDFVSTRMMCSEVVELVLGFNNALKSTKYYKVESGRLFLFNSQREEVASFDRE